MARNQSFTLTQKQYRSQTKTVTRRLGWAFAEVGDIYNGCEKCQGLKKGEKIVKMGQHQIIALRWERLDRMMGEPEYGKSECVDEGFPDMTPQQFVEMFCKANKCLPKTVVHRMEFKYLCSHRVTATNDPLFEIVECKFLEDVVFWGGLTIKKDQKLDGLVTRWHPKKNFLKVGTVPLAIPIDKVEIKLAQLTVGTFQEIDLE